jgi:uncharacterized protein (TIGR03790 family)
MRFALLSTLLIASSGFALEPKEVIVLANKNVPASLGVAEHYLEKRKVPKENLVILDLPTGEDISRADYNLKLVAPLREALKDRPNAKVLLATYGVPLRVGGQILTDEEKKKLAEHDKQLETARKKSTDLEKAKADAKEISAARNEVNGLQQVRRVMAHDESHACVDSELMLIWWKSYTLDRWVMNPLNFQASETYRTANRTMMTARIDAPTPEIAKRLVDDAIAVEAKGLTGEVVIDARGIGFNPKNARDANGTGYGGYDESFREMAKLFEKTDLPVKLDNVDKVISAGSHKNVALYTGWYSHANFVDCCEYVPGAIAWHLASSEAVTLRNKDSKVWCPNLLKKGVAATIGPVAEPYTVGFPKPAEFFGFLATGEYTLVESYSRSALFCSWMTVLVGDPLYNPFAKNPKLKSMDVLPSPKGGTLKFP